jgi:predicted transposase/invertase (TIGR01784 family)
MPERCTLRLSDAFVKKSDNYNSNQVTASDTSSNCNSSKFQPAMEITSHMININIGNNAELMEKCRLLHDYAAFIGLIRDYISQENDINTAVTLAINQAISHNILKEVLSVHIAEVRDMILTEYNEEQHIKNEKNISYDDGFNDGVECGIVQGVERGIEQGIIKGTQQTKIEAIKNMIKLSVPKDKILECYSEAEYNAAIKDDRN